VRRIERVLDDETPRSERPYLRQYRAPERPRPVIPIGRSLIILVLVAVAYEFLFSPRGYLTLRRMRLEAEDVVAERQRKEVELERTIDLRERLESGEATEETARQMYGMAKPGEEIYVLPAPESAPATDR
jgi:cell division protein FtsB